MAGEQFVDLAVASLASFYSSNLQAQLTATEAASGLVAGTLTPPREYLEELRDKDPRNPIMFIFSEDGDALDARNGLYTYKCRVALRFSSDCKTGVGQKRARQYLSAMLNVIRSDRTLGSTVVQAVESRQILFGDKPGDANILHAIAIEIDVDIHES